MGVGAGLVFFVVQRVLVALTSSVDPSWEGTAVGACFFGLFWGVLTSLQWRRKERLKRETPDVRGDVD